MGTTRTRLGRTVGVIIGLVLGSLIGAGLAMAADEDLDNRAFQDTVRSEALQAEQRDHEYKAEQHREAEERSREAQRQVQRDSERNRSYTRISPYENEGRPQACTTNGQSTYCR
jgi:hypothetical protein